MIAQTNWLPPLLPLILFVVGMLLMRRFPVASFCWFLTTVVASVIVICRRYDPPLFGGIAALFLAFTYIVMRTKTLHFSRAGSVAGCFITVILYPAIFPLFLSGHRSLVGITSGTIWLAAGVLPSVLAVLLSLGMRKIVDILHNSSVTFTDAASPGQPCSNDEEHKLVLKMLADGKIGSQEASDLLSAVGRNQRSIGGPQLALLPIIAGIVVVLGFVLPWNYLQTPMGEGYQAGYHCGTIGWIVLALGTVPGILSCVPALDKHLRQSLLGVFFGATGVVILIVLAFQTPVRGQFPIGIWITLLGFCIQLAGSLVRSGIVRPSVGKKQASA